MQKKNLALLCDYGLDDAIATAYLMNYADRFGKIDILPIGGNFPLKDAFINAKRVLTSVKNDKVKVDSDKIRIVDTACLPQPEEQLWDIHGNDGMGDVLSVEYEELVDVIGYEKWLTEIDDSYIIVSLGPCTVTLDILSQKGALPVCFMCGNVSEPPNYNGYEFNHGMDVEAFSKCLKYPHVAATLDTCHNEQCNINKLDLSGDDTLHILMRRYRELSDGRGEANCYVYDLTVAVWLVYPERFTTEVLSDKDGNVVTVLKYIGEEPIV